MKKGRIILIVVLCFMVGIVIYAVFIKRIDSPIKKQNVLTAKSEGDSQPALPENFENFKEHVNQYGESLPYDKNTVLIGQEFEYNGMSSVVNSFEITKQAIDSDASLNVDENEPIEFDPDGNILNDYTYIVVNVTITNKKSEDNEFHFSRFKYVPMSTQANDIAEHYYNGQLRGYKTKAAGENQDKGYYIRMFSPGEQLNCNLVFIQNDSEYSDYVPYVKVNPSGTVYSPEGQDKFIELR